MAEKVPTALRGLIAKQGEREEVERRAKRVRGQRRGARAGACASGGHGPRRPALKWARAVAASAKLPPSGVEIFAEGDRSRTTASVLPGGKLVFFHTFAPYFGTRVVGRRARDLTKVPIDVLRRFVEAIETGAVWEHADAALRREARRRMPR